MRGNAALQHPRPRALERVERRVERIHRTRAAHQHELRAGGDRLAESGRERFRRGRDPRDRRRGRSEESELLLQSRLELRESLLAELFLHEDCDAQRNELADAHQTAARLLFRGTDAILAGDERHDLRPRDHFAFDHHAPVRESERGHVLDLVQPPEAFRVDFEQPALRCRQREGARREGLRCLDAGPRHGRRDAPAPFVLVDVARLHLDDVQLRPGCLACTRQGLAPEHGSLADDHVAGRVAHVLRQDHSCGESLAPRDAARLHASRWRSRARRLSRLWAEAKTERCGSAACIPCVSGS